MPHRIHLAMHPPRFIRGGIRLPRRARRDDLASFFDDEQRKIDDYRAAFRAREREGR
jgi:hypothetical protein